MVTVFISLKQGNELLKTDRNLKEYDGIQLVIYKKIKTNQLSYIWEYESYTFNLKKSEIMSV